MEILSTLLLMTPSGGNSSFLTQMMPFFLIFAIIYFLLLRPQQQEQKRRTEMLESLKKGDHVTTTGGMIGRIDHLKGKDIVVLQVAKSVKLEFKRSAIGDVIPKSEEDKSK